MIFFFFKLDHFFPNSALLSPLWSLEKNKWIHLSSNLAHIPFCCLWPQTIFSTTWLSSYFWGACFWNMLTLSTIPVDSRGQSHCLCTGLAHLVILSEVWKVLAGITSFSRRPRKTCDGPRGRWVPKSSVLMTSGASPVCILCCSGILRAMPLFSHTQKRFCIQFCYHFSSTEVGLWCRFYIFQSTLVIHHPGT